MNEESETAKWMRANGIADDAKRTTERALLMQFALIEEHTSRIVRESIASRMRTLAKTAEGKPHAKLLEHLANAIETEMDTK